MVLGCPMPPALHAASEKESHWLHDGNRESYLFIYVFVKVRVCLTCWEISLVN